MNMRFLGAISLFLCSAEFSSAVDYTTIQNSNVTVTGIRSDSVTMGTDSVVITAIYNTGTSNVAALYNGPLSGAVEPSAVWNQLNPILSGQTVTSSSFYGPNTAIFNPSLGAGNVIAVGSYTYAESTAGANSAHGLLYQGTVTGSGTWAQIDATPLVLSGSLANTIAHSNMGDLVVGNYDTTETPGNAFIYNRIANTWTNLNPASSTSVTAYGIWQNGGSSSTSYTIAGGFSDLNSGGLDQGYLLNYDSSTGDITNYKTYNYDDLPITSLVSHFDGITATEEGFNLTGFYSTVDPLVDAGFFASVTVNLDGSFSEAAWTNIAVPGAAVTTGNTIIGNSVLGFYDDGSSHSFIATVPEPNALTLLPLAAGFLLLSGRSRQKA